MHVDDVKDLLTKKETGEIFIKLDRFEVEWEKRVMTKIKKRKFELTSS